MSEPVTDFFISYARKDTAFREQLVDALHRHGHTTWTDDQIPGGSNYRNRIQAAIDSCAYLIVILSETSTKSDYVEVEYTYALSQGKQVFPLVIEDCEIPFRLILIQQIPFIKGFDKGFADLLRAVKAAQMLKPDAGAAVRTRKNTASRILSLVSMPFIPLGFRVALLAAIALIISSVIATVGINYANYQTQHVALASLESTSTTQAIATKNSELAALQTATTHQTATVSAQMTATAQILLPHTEAVPGPCGDYAYAWSESSNNAVHCLSTATRVTLKPQTSVVLLYKGVYGTVPPYYDVTMHVANDTLQSILTFSTVGKTQYDVIVSPGGQWMVGIGSVGVEIQESGYVPSIQSIGIACHSDRTTFFVNGHAVGTTMANGGCSDGVSIDVQGGGSIDLSDFTFTPVS